MLVLALQFSRDGPIDRQVRAAATRAAAPVNGEMTGTKELSSLTTEQERPATRAPVVPSNASPKPLAREKETGSEVIRIAE